MSEYREPGAINGVEGNPDEAEEEMREVIGEQYSAEATSAARESGMSRQDFEGLAKRVVFDGSQMHTETRTQSQDAVVAAARLTQLQTETLLREHAAAQGKLKKTLICNGKWGNR